VYGDLYDLGEGTTTLAELDAYELAESPLPARFERAMTPATLADGTHIDAWVWWYRGGVDESQRIALGRYEKNCEPVPKESAP
jgi:gamma-glutamylcyclotransferase (GGCT)/AIG2-like uncharacterized protein YtfP